MKLEFPINSHLTSGCRYDMHNTPTATRNLHDKKKQSKPN